MKMGKGFFFRQEIISSSENLCQAMPIEINWLREYKGGDPEKFREYQRQRFRPVEWVDAVIEVDEKWRKGTTDKQALSKEINRLQKEVIAPKKKAKEPCDEVLAEVASLKKQVRCNFGARRPYLK